MNCNNYRIIFNTMLPHTQELQETIDEFLETLEANGIEASYERFIDGEIVEFNEHAWWQPENGCGFPLVAFQQGEQA